MKTCILRLTILFLGLAYLAKPDPVCAQADPKEFQLELIKRAEREYRDFFKQPVEVREFWATIEFELNVGKFELAGFFLKNLVEKEPKDAVDVELIKIFETVGPKPFQRLRNVKSWSKNQDFDKECRANVNTMIKRVTDGIEKALSDPERIRKYIKLLDAPTKEERDNAYIQLMRSEKRVIPALLDTIRNGAGTPLRGRAIEAFVRMEPELVAPLYEILHAVDEEDAKDTNLRLAVLQIFRNRGDFACIPYLWHLSTSTKYPYEVRETAREVLGYLREEDPNKLPSAKWMLTELAEKCFQHKLKVEVVGYPIWRWDGKSLDQEPDYMPRRKAEYFFGLRYAKQALELDPAYKPAQTVFLNFVLERNFDLDLDKYFFKPMPQSIQDLLLGLDPELLMSILERAQNENNVPIMLPLIDILALRGDLRAVQPTLGNPPTCLVRGLYNSDRRVQYATVRALLKMPYRGAPAESMRIVEILRRFVAAEPVSRTLVAMCPKEEVLKAKATFESGGFKNVETRCTTLEETFEKLRRSADYDVIFIHPGVRAAELPFVVTQLRADGDQGRLPLIILSSLENHVKWKRMFEKYPNTWVELDSFMTMPEMMRNLAEEKIELAGGGFKPSAKGFKLSREERAKFTWDSMVYIWKMGKGEIPGYNVRSTQDTLRATLHRTEVNPDANPPEAKPPEAKPPEDVKQPEMKTPEKVVEKSLAEMALQTAALNPDRDTQVWLANVFFDPAFEKLKLTAITELRQHILKNGLNLEKNHVANLRAAEKAANTPEDVRMQLRLILANNLRFSPQLQGKKLGEFEPPVRP